MDVDRTWGSTLVKNHDENKTYILVKLSESFSNAIQEFSAPKIKFHGSRGAIRFPNGKSYDFSLEQSDNTVECIRQSKNRWESVGKTACCLHVKGKDDVYQRTKTKMEAAEQEKRTKCTKLLGSPEHESTTISASRTSATTSINHISIPSSHSTTNNPLHYNNANNHSLSTSRSSKLQDTSANYKSSSSSALIQAPAALNNFSAASDFKSSLVSALPTGSATTYSSSSSASSSSAAPASSANSNNNHVNLSKYPNIINVEQMHRYKAEFDKDFKEYQHLHGYLHRIEERFRKLKETLKRSVEGSPEWESAKGDIFNEYERLKGDSNFHKARSKYQQLYNKLNHIKEKIFQFKQELKDKSNSRKRRKR